MAGCSRLVPKPGSPVQPSQSCLALAVQFSVVILKLSSSFSPCRPPPPPSRMKKPPAGLGGLSALSGWVLTVYLHKYLSPSYAACLCDSLYLFIFPPAARLAVCCSPRYARADATTPGHHVWARVRTLPGSPAPSALRDRLGN